MEDLKIFFTRKSARKRLILFFIGDILLLILSAFLSFYIRLGNDIFQSYLSLFHIFLIFSIVFKIPIIGLFKLYNISWRFVSLDEAIKLFMAITFGEILLYLTLYILHNTGVIFSLPRSILLLDYMLSFILIGIFRLFKRLVNIILLRRGNFYDSIVKKTLIVGGGSAGEQMIREFLKKDTEYYPMCIIDNNKDKWGTYIHGVKIVGGNENLEKSILYHKIDTIIIAIPTISYRQLKDIMKIVKRTGVDDIKVLPSITDIMNDTVSVNDLRPVKLEDLLGRKPVEIDNESINNMINERIILVTGAGGSIGSELCKQICRFRPKKLIMFEVDETDLFLVTTEIYKLFPYIEIVDVIGDIRNTKKIEYAISNYKPDIIFHSAAYKHVFAMEKHPDEAVTNNIIGTDNVAKAAVKFGVDRFIMISTDKAVNPTSIMGATKRVAEILVRSYNEINSTKFISVRFGNVLGSRGSVIPIFQKQIEEGGPITITHPDMKRYFMLIPEACLLVLESAYRGKGGEVFVLDMGESVYIKDVAKQLVEISGLIWEKDIDIVYTGMRPGEKLFEELLTAEEGTTSTKHKKIFKAKQSANIPHSQIESYINKLVKNKHNRRKLDVILKELVPTYKR